MLFIIAAAESFDILIPVVTTDEEPIHLTLVFFSRTIQSLTTVSVLRLKGVGY